VHLLKDKTAAGLQRGNLPAHMRGNLVRRCLRQDALGVAAAAPERFNPAGSMPLQVIWTGLIASRPASIRPGSSSRTPPQQCNITFR